MKRLLSISIVLTGIVLSGCATQVMRPADTFQAEDLNSKAASGQLEQKVNNFLVIVDSSSSMSSTYDGAGFGDEPLTKYSVERELLNRMNKTIPDISLSSGIRSFGFGPCTDWSFTKLNQPMGSYSPSSFASGLDTLTCSSGGSPMAEAFSAATDDLASASGNVTIILLSDGYEVDAFPGTGLNALKEKLGDRLCVYPIWVGNKSEASGHRFLKRIFCRRFRW